MKSSTALASLLSLTTAASIPFQSLARRDDL